MTCSAEPPVRLRAIEFAPADLLDDPLAYFFAEHWRHRQFCTQLSELSGARTAPPAQLRALAGFLENDFALHAEDEENDLFRLLRIRCEAADDIERVLGILTADHGADRGLAAALCSGLSKAAAAGVGPLLQPGLSDLIGRFVTHKMRHISLENAIVLPIARLRLTRQDCLSLAAAMKARRGMPV